MGRRVSAEKILNTLAERTIDHNRLLKRQINQRRNGMEDLYGQPFIVYGDASSPASFYISLSPDYTYLERFAFKFVIMPYQTTVTGGTDSVAVTVDNRSLEVRKKSGTTDEYEVNPNPHNHTTRPHTHNLISGKSFIHTTSRNWEVWIAGVNITPYLQEQVADIPNGWLGQKTPIEGIYPNASLSENDGRVVFYDILGVYDILVAEGEQEKADALTEPEMKLVEIKSDAPFGIQAYLYVKYPNNNR